jgi:hypothetical protein
MRGVRDAKVLFKNYADEYRVPKAISSELPNYADEPGKKREKGNKLKI